MIERIKTAAPTIMATANNSIPVVEFVSVVLIA
jgi:hypothetical protein